MSPANFPGGFVDTSDAPDRLRRMPGKETPYDVHIINDRAREEYPGMGPDDLFEYAAEATFLLKTLEGYRAKVEVTLAIPSEGDPEILGDRFCGKGIYLASNTPFEDNEPFPVFWVAVPRGELTAAKIRVVAEKVRDILLFPGDGKKKFWQL